MRSVSFTVLHAITVQEKVCVNYQSLLYTRRVANILKTAHANKRETLWGTLCLLCHFIIKREGENKSGVAAGKSNSRIITDQSLPSPSVRWNTWAFKMQSSLSVRRLWVEGAAECLKVLHRERFSSPERRAQSVSDLLLHFIWVFECTHWM